MDIAELLAFAVKNKASDLHLSSGLPPMVRVDGDLRRLAEREDEFFRLTAAEVAVSSPKFIAADSILDAALALMEHHSISQVVTVDDDGKMVGILHLHDILKSKLV